MQGDFMRLRSEIVAKLAKGGDWDRTAAGSRTEFEDWARNRRNPPVRFREHNWTPLKHGLPVPRQLVEAFSEFISTDLKIGRYPVSCIAESSDPPNKEHAKPPRISLLKKPWRVGWLILLAALKEDPTLPEEAYCRGEEDVRDAAKMVMLSVAGRADSKLSGRTAMALAERIMERTLDEYAALLFKLWKASEDTVIFTMDRGERLGVTVAAPVTEGFHRRFRSGQAEDMDITEADVVSRSKFVLHAAAAENRNLDVRKAKGERAGLLARTVLHQFAATFVPLDPFNDFFTALHLISFAGNEESRARLESYHYKKVGAKTPVTGKEIMEFRSPTRDVPDDEYMKGWPPYLAMFAVLMIFQHAMSEQQIFMGE